MAKLIKEGRLLDAVQYGEIPYQKRTRDGIPYVTSGTGFNLKFNLLPPGMDLVDANHEFDDHRIAGIKPTGPIVAPYR
jgi:hypothetical protein